ncbi:MAG: 30S ribosomal protein S20 [Dehalococcoidaceae bacterium]|nr:30S ribosomal protein S20 [Dehalococcoidaceae bacterium]|tara:strand:- start:23794 stop:24054 length:261 start_codon:yes stop_codon:yes gene_type:complete
MALSNQAKKRVRQNKKSEEHNRTLRSRLSRSIRLVYQAIDNEDEKTNDLIKDAQSNLDRAAKKNIIHKNKAARTKSRIDKYLNKTK